MRDRRRPQPSPLTNPLTPPKHKQTHTQAVILPLAFHVAHTFLALSTPLKRLEAAARSPVYAHFTEAAAGLVVLRAYRAEAQFLARLHDDIDRADQTHFILWWVGGRWGGMVARVVVETHFILWWVGGGVCCGACYGGEGGGGTLKRSHHLFSHARCLV